MTETDRAFAEHPLPFLLDEAEPLPLPAGKTPSYIADHRQRLRSRFLQGGSLMQLLGLSYQHTRMVRTSLPISLALSV